MNYIIPSGESNTDIETAPKQSGRKVIFNVQDIISAVL